MATLPSKPKQKTKLPTIAELYGEVGLAQETDKLVALLNQEPPQSWVKVHPYISGYKYLPIERVEYLLKSIFKDYSIKVLKTGILLNTIEVTVRIEARNPITGEVITYDGVGAQEIQTRKDSGHLKADMSNINRGAVQMALPIAKTLAVKDAADHFGKLFGSDLNRKTNIEYGLNDELQEIDLDTLKKGVQND